MWKGSLYKLVYLDLIFYLSLYYALSLSYRLLLNEPGRRTFEQVVHFANSVKNNIPLSFLLGFFVSGVINRWWAMFLEIPWMNRYSFLAQGIVAGSDPELARQIRLTLLRYLNLGWILVMRKISDQIAKRFRPEGLKNRKEKNVREVLNNLNSDPVVHRNFTKIITQSEIGAFERVANQFECTYKKDYECEYWVPLLWASRLIKKSFLHGYIPDPRSMMYLLEEMDKMRHQMHTLVIYNDVMIPLVYTQVVIIAVYSYFLLQLFSAQFIHPPNEHGGGGSNSSCCCQTQDVRIDFFVPIFTIFQFLFLMGWLKVAMCVMNPFGDDDEDFQTSEILDYNLEISRRSAAADELMFPHDFQLPRLQTKAQPGAEEDNLNEFLAKMSVEMDRRRRELLLDDVDCADGLASGGGFQRDSNGSGIFSDGCCWSVKDESFVRSYSRELAPRPVQVVTNRGATMSDRQPAEGSRKQHRKPGRRRQEPQQVIEIPNDEAARNHSEEVDEERHFLAMNAYASASSYSAGNSPYHQHHQHHPYQQHHLQQHQQQQQQQQQHHLRLQQSLPADSHRWDQLRTLKEGSV